MLDVGVKRIGICLCFAWEIGVGVQSSAHASMVDGQAMLRVDNSIVERRGRGTDDVSTSGGSSSGSSSGSSQPSGGDGKDPKPKGKGGDDKPVGR